MKRNKVAAVVLSLSLGLAGSVALAGHEVAVLDGTSWKVEVHPDEMTEKKGEKSFDETMLFADGMVSLTEYGKMGFASSPYTVTKSGEKDWTFKTESTSASNGASVWTGKIHEDGMNGKLILTKADGSVLTYSFKGHKME